MEVVSVELLASAALPQGKDPGTPRIGRCVGPGAGLDNFEKSKFLAPCQDSNTGS